MAKVHISSIGPKVDPLQVTSSPPSLLVIRDSSIATATAATDTPSSSSSSPATVVVVTGNKTETTTSTCSTVPPSTTTSKSNQQHQQHHEQSFELLRMLLLLPCHKLQQFHSQLQFVSKDNTCRCKSLHREYKSQYFKHFGHSLRDRCSSNSSNSLFEDPFDHVSVMPCLEHIFELKKKNSKSNNSNNKNFTCNVQPQSQQQQQQQQQLQSSDASSHKTQQINPSAINSGGSCDQESSEGDDSGGGGGGGGTLPPPGTLSGASSTCNSTVTSDHCSKRPSQDVEKTLDEGKKVNSDESLWTALKELVLAFMLAGMGNIAASYWLAKVTTWAVFRNIPQLVILVPPLLGLKGNVEMTLASRLSTHANLGDLDKESSKNKIILGNMALIQCQASTVGFIAPIIALGLSYVSEHAKGLKTSEIILLTASSVITANVANLILGSLMCMVILASRKFNINPDNIATPIAASLGDVTTMILLANISHFLYVNLDTASWVQNTLLAFLMALIPIWANIARRNSFTSDVIVSGWYPVCGAMLIQNAGGLVMEKALGIFPRIANLQLVINGVGGNLVAIQASRMSTHLHKYSSPKELPESDGQACTYPGSTFISSRSAHSRMARLLLLMALPAHVCFLLVTEWVNENYYFTPAFITIYLGVCFFQVTFLLQLAYNFVHWLWRVGVNPDNSAIPFLTAFADLIGAVLLASAFVLLFLTGDVNASISEASTGHHPDVRSM